MNELVSEKNDKVESLIYEIRGKQVMLDSDLARLYECKNGTKTINQAVGRHKDRFPEDFIFNLSSISTKPYRSTLSVYLMVIVTGLSFPNSSSKE